MHAPVAKDEWLGQTKEGGKKIEKNRKKGIYVFSQLCLTPLVVAMDGMA
jgi:hypothetical protein